MGHLSLKGLAPQTGTTIFFYDLKKKKRIKSIWELFVQIKFNVSEHRINSTADHL